MKLKKPEAETILFALQQHLHNLTKCDFNDKKPFTTFQKKTYNKLIPIYKKLQKEFNIEMEIQHKIWD